MGLPEPLIKVSFKDGDDGHYYSQDGENTWFPGVTTVLRLLGKPALVPWAAKRTAEYFRDGLLAEPLSAIGDDEQFYSLSKQEIDALFEKAKKAPYAERDAAGLKGNDVHAAIEAYLLTKSKPTDPEIQPSFEQFLKWWDNCGWTLVAGDTPVICKSLGYGGRLDSIFQDENGDLVLVDWKTSKGIYSEMFWQLGAYRLALQETYGVTTKRMGILHIRPDKIQWYEAKNPSLCVMGFSLIKNLYDTIKQLEAEQNKEN